MPTNMPLFSQPLTVNRLPFSVLGDSIDDIVEGELANAPQGYNFNRQGEHDAWFEGVAVDITSAGPHSPRPLPWGGDISTSLRILASTTDSVTFDLAFHDWTTTYRSMEFSSWRLTCLVLDADEYADLMPKIKTETDSWFSTRLPENAFRLVGFGWAD